MGGESESMFGETKSQGWALGEVFGPAERFFEQMVEQEVTSPEDRESLPYWLSTIRYGIHSVQGRIRWCEETIAILQTRTRPNVKGDSDSKDKKRRESNES